MGTFSQDFWANLEQIILNDLNIPEGVSVGYSTYVALTNIFLSSRRAGSL